MSETYTHREREPKPHLSFEAFTAVGEFGIPRFNNFHLHFATDGASARIKIAARYREAAHYKKFAEECPDLASELITKVSEALKDRARPTAEVLAPLYPLLYEVYVVMRKSVERDEELFV